MKNNQIIFKITILYSIFWVAIFYSSYSYLKTIKPFQIKNIIINGNEFIETKSILGSIQILLDNKNLFNTEIEELKNILNKNKFIDNVKIYSLLPSTIKINIIEKKPIALINNNNNRYFIDNNSNIIEADIKSINHFINTPIINIVYSSGGALIFSFYIVYDTQLIVGGEHKKIMFHTDDYVLAAISLYLDVVNLFLYILELLNGGRN